MRAPKPPKRLLIDSFIYKEYLGEDEDVTEAKYDEQGVNIEHCRIDRGSKYSSSASGKQILYNAVVFCYKGLTTPLPDFKDMSILHFDGKDHKITEVIPIYEPYEKEIYAYEIEVI